jgi:FtsP/CotA-like multicopper oxidase with cupredoxin domain
MRLARRGVLGGLAAAGLGLALPGSRAALGEAAGIELVTAERPFRLLGAERPPIPLWSYAEGPAPFPVHRVRRSQRVVATLENRLKEHTTIHWHGVRLPNAMDGVPWLTQRPVYPGERFTYEFTPPDAGTFFFHPHCNTVVQLGRGLAGVLVVEGDEHAPYDADLVMVLKDWRLKENGEFDAFITERGASRAGTFGQVRTVNGMICPTLDVPAGGDVRLRLLNVDPTRVAEIGFEGLEAALIAIDGNAVGPLPLRSWRLGPAMRVDLVVRAPAAGATATLYDYFSAQPVELARLRGVGPDRPRRPFEPRGLIANDLPEPDLANAEHQRCLFSATATAGDIPPDTTLPDGSVLRYADGLCLSQQVFWAINRQVWPLAGHERLPPPLDTFVRGRTYVLELVNGTPQQHPIHLHGMSFKVVKPNRGLPVHWADTVLLGPKDRVEVAFVADNPGDWMLHCHIIEHQETGMMGYVRVA